MCYFSFTFSIFSFAFKFAFAAEFCLAFTSFFCVNFESFINQKPKPHATHNGNNHHIKAALRLRLGAIAAFTRCHTIGPWLHRKLLCHIASLLFKIFFRHTMKFYIRPAVVSASLSIASGHAYTGCGLCLRQCQAAYLFQRVYNHQ